jgi:hypothetical protein
MCHADDFLTAAADDELEPGVTKGVRSVMEAEDKLMAQIERRRAAMSKWLDENAPYAQADQAHLRANTPERAYWHYGYMIALRDVALLLTANTIGKTGTSD